MVEQIHKLNASTLAELRAVIEATAHLPGDAEVLVRTKVSFKGEGSPLTRIHIAEQDA